MGLSHWNAKSSSLVVLAAGSYTTTSICLGNVINVREITSTVSMKGYISTMSLVLLCIDYIVT